MYYVHTHMLPRQSVIPLMLREGTCPFASWFPHIASPVFHAASAIAPAYDLCLAQVVMGSGILDNLVHILLFQSSLAMFQLCYPCPEVCRVCLALVRAVGYMRGSTGGFYIS